MNVLLHARLCVVGSTWLAIKGTAGWARSTSPRCGLTAILFATLPLITIVFAHLYIPRDGITAQSHR